MSDFTCRYGEVPKLCERKTCEGTCQVTHMDGHSAAALKRAEREEREEQDEPSKDEEEE